ncbi:MAG: ORF6N domain-containing protein [Elusimicrobia bacterium]|nr:ORF6N domain-containing protein [Elusimicrobiota bacterium]
MDNLQPHLPPEEIIVSVRGLRVILDAQLATLYGVPTKALNLAVKRNQIRFPNDFMFRLTPSEFAHLRFQSETSSWGGRRHPPLAFTEQGVAMLSSVLRGRRAALVNISIMRAFVRMRRATAPPSRLARRVRALESRVSRNEASVEEVLAFLRALGGAEPPARRRIGFRREA